jgi:uncharacterized membrane protein YhhN
MKNLSSIFISLYGILCAANLAAIAFQSETGNYFTKPLLITTLCCWFYFETKNRSTAFSRFLLMGLFFSIAGDTFLMFVKPGAEHFFLLGLGSFLVTHLFYITAFSKYPLLKNGLVWKKRWLIAPLLIYLSGFSWFIWAELPGDFRIPVVVYAAVITLMALSSLNLNGRTSRGAFQVIFSGAVLFVISDSLIALKKFKFPDAPEVPFGLAIMVTYLLGQYLIAKGTVSANHQAV